ncbi:MAG: Ig-like domain-containing protein [Bacteroidota bacterium]
MGLALLVWQCAKPLSPDGGPRDKIAPTIAKTAPAHQSLEFDGDEVKIYFSETIRKPTYDKELFISPFTKKPKIILADNSKRFRIKFEEPLRPNTTYVITLVDIRDANEGNKLEEPFTLAFSTGDQLDSMEIKGRIQAPVVGTTVEEMTVMLFDADSAINQDFAGLRPAYLTKSDENGEFKFQYLRDTDYRILSIQDADQSNSYTPPIELVAASVDTLLRFPDDSTNLATVVLYSFLPDEAAPRLQGLQWFNDSTLLCRFDENLRLDSLHIWVGDTLGQDSIPITDFSWYPGTDPQLLVHVPRPSHVPSRLVIEQLQDSLWNTAASVDTLLKEQIEVASTKPDERDWEEPLLSKPLLKPELNAWEMLAGRRISPADMAYFQLTDTATADSNRIIFPYEWEQDGFELRLRLSSPLDSLVPMILRISGSFMAPEDSLFQDSLFAYPVQWFDSSAFGTLAGTLVLDSSYTGPIVLQLMNSKDQVIRTVYDTLFDFQLLPPDTYSFRLIADKDSNQTWSPGRLYPARAAEKIYPSPETIEVQTNLDFEEFTLEMNLPEIEANAVRKAAAAAQAAKEEAEAKEKGESTKGGGNQPPTGGPGSGGAPPTGIGGRRN